MENLGLDLLMNQKKRSGSSDSISLGSRSENDDKQSIYSGSDRGSVKSISIKPSVIDVGNTFNSNNIQSNDDYETESSSDVSYVSKRSSKKQYDQRERMPSSSQYREREREHSRQQYKADTESNDGSQLESLGSIANQKRYSEEDILLMKKELLYQFERLEKRGFKLPKKFTLSSNLQDMQIEFERLKNDRKIDNSIKMQRKIMMTSISTVEWLNTKFDPFGIRLQGWGDSVYENIDDYDDIFENLYEKYKGKGEYPPELQLLMMLGGSAFMHHLTHSMFKNQLPGLDSILKNNPDLARQLADATTDHMQQQQSGANSLFGSLGNMFSGLFGGGGNNNQQAPPQAPSQAPSQQQTNQGQFNMPQMARPQPSNQEQQNPGIRMTMKGPSNIDELLKEFENDNNDRVETISVLTESELDNLDDDSSSINGILIKKKKGNKKTMQF